MPTLWRNVHIASCDEQGRTYSPGAVLTDAGRIAWVGAEADLPAGTRAERTIELAGRWLTPGLIDCHTHLVFAGQRAAEFAQRTSGRSYSDIARGGGGILSTVRDTRAASESQLLEAARPRLASLLAEGVTCDRDQVRLRAHARRRSSDAPRRKMARSPSSGDGVDKLPGRACAAAGVRGPRR